MDRKTCIFSATGIKTAIDSSAFSVNDAFLMIIWFYASFPMCVLRSYCRPTCYLSPSLFYLCLIAVFAVQIIPVWVSYTKNRAVHACCGLWLWLWPVISDKPLMGQKGELTVIITQRGYYPFLSSLCLWTAHSEA